jgi:hypothetical protein
MSQRFVRPEGRVFCDILDGYFTLRESLRQMLARNGFSGAWLTLLHAPMMHIKGLPEDAPIPLHLRGDYAGMIEQMSLTALIGDKSIDCSRLSLFALGDWYWADRPRYNDLPADVRLGEPAYVEGIGWGEASALEAAPRARQGILILPTPFAQGGAGTVLRWFQA